MKSIAVIGSGIAGLSAAWLLAKHHHVTLYEADDRLGGHSHSVEVTLEGKTAAVDTGFLVCNDRTYPNLLNLFAMLEIPLTASDMSFSVQIADDELAWAGTSIATLFADKRNLVRPRFWLMIKDILRFNREARRLLEDKLNQNTLEEFLVHNNYSTAFRDWYLLPMAAAIWSCPTQQMLDFPARSFIHFFDQHGLLQITNRPQWLTINGGSRNYVQRIADCLPRICLSQAVSSITRTATGVQVTSSAGTRDFDEVVLATHSDQSLAMLSDFSADESRILSAIKYQPNKAILHTDSSILPARSMWSAWNFHTKNAAPGQSPVSVTYLINQLQPLPFQTPVMVTLNPDVEIAADKIIRSFDYAHPVFDQAAITAQTQLSQIQGKNHTWFCGAWTGFGFHEDGLKSGMAVAQSLGASIPWVVSS
ncbi:NAD(P)/FAD-dependent oxidoreductase [Sulfuriferula nivalis]|uniref:NAD/FAD-binding protein n=1 Tax=Sulfuriferula nivalis TaxID=2675298 RepID=A0A809S900_9PROT|nr:FAD-dependent oxidoreductase [Sulfuriferula nivalis]BBP00903.1 NAD/FAD-binding protein [Sulfuriferula nivalis]